MLSKYNYVGMGIIVGFIATFFWFINNDNDTGYDTTFLLIKKDKYTFTDKNLQEDYKDWEEGYILTLKEDRAEIVEKISIFTDSHNFTVEMWVKIKFLKNVKIKFVPTLLDERLTGANAFKFKNSIKVLFNTIRLIFYYHIYRYLK